MAEQNLDGLVLFRQDSMYYLTGYDTSGYTMFQGMYLGSGRRARDCSPAPPTGSSRGRLRRSPTCASGTTARTRVRARICAAMLEDYGCRGKRLGVEYHAYGLTGQRARMIDAALDGFCELVDASDLVRLLATGEERCRARVRAKGGRALRPHPRGQHREGERYLAASVKAVYGAMLQALCEGGGDPAASRWPIGAGRQGALRPLPHGGRRRWAIRTRWCSSRERPTGTTTPAPCTTSSPGGFARAMPP